MGSLFSNISGQFGKNFVIAALLPATIFVVVLYFFILPMAPLQFGVIGRLQAIETQWQVGAGVAAATIVAALLYSLNYLLLRLYEGYGWKLSPTGRALTAWQERCAGKEIAKRDTIDALSPPGGSELSDYANALTLQQNVRYPTRAFLPTRFGNRLRAFEEYPQRQYNLEAIRLWPHFVSELDKDHAAAIDDAKSGVDMFVNLSFLSWVTFVAMLLLGVWIPIPLASPPLLAWWIVRMAIALIAGVLLYCAAVMAAGGWGEAVKATFDLHRADVLKRFGYDMPDDLEIERALWQAISWQLLYEGPTAEKKRWHYRGGPFLAPLDPDVKLSRSVVVQASPPNAEGTQSVRLVVRNTGVDPIDELTVVDRIGDAFLVANSATIDGVPYEPVGTRQLAFRLPAPLPAGAQAIIAYQLWLPKK